MIEVELTPGASADLDDIALFSIAEFGPQAARKYVSNLHSVIARLRDYPNSGAIYPGITPSTRYARSGSHHVFYRQVGSKLVVSRILHHAMSPEHWLGE